MGYFEKELLKKLKIDFPEHTFRLEDHALYIDNKRVSLKWSKSKSYKTYPKWMIWKKKRV